ncbi:multiple C2 and transmembrane domain-containing protein 2 [Gadus macrocephalus]|uniref:multiple C2 and transmembrane domain-containing protein 2 n=1 Tax=Gadus macrocephalus TaxID=80720 RepID=UPI0028CBB2BE|nr:multiple C2 and transmembrane domain-containing protein 2 [Gadus macrocephalus]
MESKKKPFFLKFLQPKKAGKKTGDKQGKKLAHRRSISFPDLRMLPDAGLPDSPGPASSPSQSDNESIASENIPCERPSSDRANYDVAPVLRYPPTRDYVDNRITAPAESFNHSDDSDYIRRRMNSSGKWSFHSEPGRVPRANVMEPAPSLLALPVPSPRHVSANQLVARLAALDGRENLDRSDTSSVGMSEAVSSALSRASSFGDQGRGPASPSFLRVSPSQGPREQAERWAPLPDGYSDEERGVVTWNTDSEDQDREIMSQYFSKLEENPAEEEEEEEEEEQENPTMDPNEVNEQDDLFDEVKRDLSDNSAGPSASPISPLQSQRYLLNINLKEGKNLAIKNRRSATSDPYVKFKIEGKQFYKSKVVYKSLNPHWNESFSHPLRDKDHGIEARVYDKNLTSDEFMGSTMISISNLELYKNYEIELRLDDPKSKEDNLGSIVVDLCLMYRDATIKRNPINRWPQKKNKVCI